jgi:hypothetical protein
VVIKQCFSSRHGVCHSDTCVYGSRTVPVFVPPRASTTYRTVVVTTQLSLATLGFVSSIL